MEAVIGMWLVRFILVPDYVIHVCLLFNIMFPILLQNILTYSLCFLFSTYKIRFPLAFLLLKIGWNLLYGYVFSILSNLLNVFIILERSKSVQLFYYR